MINKRNGPRGTTVAGFRPYRDRALRRAEAGTGGKLNQEGCVAGPVGRRLLNFSAWAFLWTPALASAAAVAGEVYDVRTGGVVAGAKVTLGGETATSGADGLFRLIAAPREPSRIVASAPGYVVTVIRYLPVVPTPEEIWQNVPLMPKATAAPYGGDFVDLFFERGPLEEVYDGYVVARRIEELPLGVSVANVGAEEASAAAERLEALNERWGTCILAVAAGDEADVKLDFGPGLAEAFDGRTLSAAFAGGVTGGNLDLAEAFLRRIVLDGGLGRIGAIKSAALRADLPLAEDLDAVVEIVYREPADFNYAIFRRRPPTRFLILTDLYLAIGGYARHGVTDETGKAVEFPAEYQLGQITLAAGGAYRNVWAKAGFWFAGIWDAQAEELFVPGGVQPDKVLRRNFSTYYRGGYWLRPVAGVRTGPIAGYRTLSVRGKFEESARPESPTAPLDIDYTSRYDGFEAGLGVDVAFGRYGLGLFGEYARIFAARPYNLAEFGFGAVNRVGVGTFAFARFYWGEPLEYTFGGLAMKIGIPL